MITIMNTEERAEAVRAVPAELNPVAGEVLEKLQEGLIGERISRIEFGPTWPPNGIWLRITTLTGAQLQIALDFNEWDLGGIDLRETQS